MMSKKKCFGLFAGCALATGALYASSVTNTFESGVESWTGGTQGVSNFTYTAVAGLPAGAALPDPNHVLLVEGEASCSPSLSGTPLLDMMVQTARPDEELEIPEDDAASVHIAVAVDSNGCFNVYCKNKSGTAAWYKLSDTEYADSAWARVSLLFDYGSKRCQVRIDGQPMMTANGYLTASITDDGTENGAWYKLANESVSGVAVSGVAGMKVIGCTAIDEVVMNETSTSYAVAANVTNDVGVSCAWLDEYGLGWDGATANKEYDNTGMTVAQKYSVCLSPFDNEKFEVKSMTVSDANGTATVTVGIPEFIATPGRKVVIDYGTDSTFTSKNTEDVPVNASTVNITAPEGNVIYYRLRATKDE